MIARALVIAAALPLAVVGCSSAPRTYSSEGPKNFHVDTKVDGGSKRAAVAFDIHRVDAKCQTDFAGRVNLENGGTDLGLPVGVPLYLEFIFVTSGSVFNSSLGATRQGMLFIAKPGFDYRADVTYEKGIYAVDIHEARKGAKRGRVLALPPLSACRART